MIGMATLFIDVLGFVVGIGAGWLVTRQLTIRGVL